MGTNRTIILVYGWKVELGDLKGDDDIQEIMDVLYTHESNIRMSRTIYIEHGGEMFFGYTKRAEREVYSVSAETISDEDFRFKLAEALPLVRHKGLKIALDMAMEFDKDTKVFANPPKWWAVMEVSY